MEGIHHDTYDDLAKAAKLGCRICHHLQQFRNRGGADEAGELMRPFTTYVFQWTGVAIRTKASWLNGTSEYYAMDVDLHISDAGPAPRWWPRFIRGVKRDLKKEPWNVREALFGASRCPGSTGDPKVLNLGLKWLESCQHHHTACQAVDQDRQKDYYPARLLDVGTLHSNKIRLVTTNLEQPDQEHRYATLSHCWGTNPSFIRLTTENLPQLTSSLTLQSLPKSFVDAIVSCRRLNIRYLWIDSLCILQSGPGAEEDWQRHVGKMDVIYANCVLNIGVVHASKPEQGAFVERNASLIQTTFVYMHAEKKFYNKSQGTSVRFHRGSGIGIEETRVEDGIRSARTPTDLQDGSDVRLVTVLVEAHDHYHYLGDQPLWKRGWVFQERLMAPRMLLFGSDRIYWRCHERLLNEYLPHGRPPYRESSSWHATYPFSLPDILHPHKLRDWRETLDNYQQWYQIIDHYSEADLTFPEKDKLAAISAIARRFDLLIPGRYWAGIFESDLHYGLLWNQVDAHKGVARLKQLDWSLSIVLDQDPSDSYRAPSWSWASVNGRTWAPIWQSREDPQTTSSIENVSIVLKDAKNPFGQVISAELTISGRLILLSDLVEGWTRCPNNEYSKDLEPGALDEKLFGLFIMDVVRRRHEGYERNKPYCFQVYGIILSQVHENTYQRRGGFSAERPVDGSPFPVQGSECRTVLIV